MTWASYEGLETAGKAERQKSPSPGRNPRRNSFRKQRTAASVSLPIISTCLWHGERNMPRTPQRKPFIPGLWKPYKSKPMWDVLLFGETEEKAALIADYGKDVIQLEQRMAELAAADAARTKKHHERHAAAPEH